MTHIIKMSKGLIEACTVEGFRSLLKMVEGAHIFKQNGIIYIQHYETIIFAYDPKNKYCEIDYDCSPVSNRQIDNALSFFELPKALCVNVHRGEKMNFSRPL